MRLLNSEVIVSIFFSLSSLFLVYSIVIRIRIVKLVPLLYERTTFMTDEILLGVYMRENVYLKVKFYSI
jgi:hypothetical protein